MGVQRLAVDALEVRFEDGIVEDAVVEVRRRRPRRPLDRRWSRRSTGNRTSRRATRFQRKTPPKEHVRGSVAPVQTPEYVRENTHPGPDRPSGMSTDGSESLLDRSESAPDPESLQKRLRCRSAKIKREELEAAAVSKLEARGDLTDEQRETVRERSLPCRGTDRRPGASARAGTSKRENASTGSDTSDPSALRSRRVVASIRSTVAVVLPPPHSSLFGNSATNSSGAS